MKTRDRLEEVGRNIDANKGTFKDDGKQLLNDYYDTLREDSSEPDQNPLVDLALLIYNLDETTQKS